MTLTEMMKTLPGTVRGIKESMTVIDPSKEISLRERGERLVRGTGPHWERKVAEAAKLIADCLSGRKPDYYLREAMTTSDFPGLMGDVLYRQMLGNYQPWPVTYPRWAYVREVRDFRTLNMYTLDGSQGLLDKVKELAPYPETKFTEGKYQLSVNKYGKRFGVSWELLINDDLDAFSNRARVMADGARRSEEYLATGMLVDANGPNASFFTAGNKNIVTGNPRLTVQGLQTAMIVLASQVDTEGQPIMIDSFELVVPPALEITAQNIMNALQLRINSPAAPNGGGTIDQFLYAENWMKGRMTMSVNPYIPYIATTNSIGQSSWFVIAKSTTSGRPAFFFGFLRGYREPQLFMKAPDAVPLGGGNPSPTDGSFDIDGIDYKLRHVFGAASGDPKMAVASNGTEIP